ncbi:MAG TPA: hypothetical protein VMG10_11550 [Gemmataceae bacterium]|nr:hypothetical protein [Gemmataceae bacterium]
MTNHRHMGLAVILAAILASERLTPELQAQEKEAQPSKARAEDERGTHLRIMLYPTGWGSRFSSEVVADKDGSVRLAHSVLLADEIGATDYRQIETLSARVQAKKVFRMDTIDVSGAELFFFGTAKQVSINGHPLKSQPLVSTGWTRARVASNSLNKGRNEIVFSGGGSLLIEPGRPGRSYKSSDGGATWSNRELGGKGQLQGEYLVRLRLPRYAPRGWWMSPVVELWRGGLEEVRKPRNIVRFIADADLNKSQPEGTRLTAWLRTGDTPVPDDRNWTSWRKLDRDLKPEKTTAGHRWAQLRYDLETTRAQATPRLQLTWIEFRFTQPEDGWRKGESIRILLPRNESGEPDSDLVEPPGLIPSLPFVYQQPSPRLKLLREKYQLDKVIAPGKSEMEQLMLLRYWVRNQCHRGWASHPALWIPPWDSLLILESRDRPDCLVMCTHFSCIFTQCCLALGWNARHCILDHHCVSEVWVDQHRKWVMMDTGNSAERADVGLHFEHDGVPLSARELQQIYRSGKTEDVKVGFTPERLTKQIASLCRPAPPPKGKLLARPDTIPLAELKKYPVCQLENYRRYAFPPRNNFLTTLYPGELEHGFSNYFYDGYCWVGDSPDDPRISPEYSRHLPPERVADIDWDLNWVRLHLSRTAKPGEVQVDVESHVPNLARLEKTTSQSTKETKTKWQPAAARFVWKLKPGRNVLTVRGVNLWERAGEPSRVEVEWTPPR